MAPINTGPSAPPSLAPSRAACVRLAIGPRRCHLETQLDFETLAGDALNLCVLSNVQRRSCPTPSKRRLRANGGSRPRQNRSWPIASQSSRAAAEKRRAPVQGESRRSCGSPWSPARFDTCYYIHIPTCTSTRQPLTMYRLLSARPYRSLCPSPWSPAS